MFLTRLLSHVPAAWFGACCPVNPISTCQTSLKLRLWLGVSGHSVLEQGMVSREEQRTDLGVLEGGFRTLVQVVSVQPRPKWQKDLQAVNFNAENLEPAVSLL